MGGTLTLIDIARGRDAISPRFALFLLPTDAGHIDVSGFGVCVWGGGRQGGGRQVDMGAGTM